MKALSFLLLYFFTVAISVAQPKFSITLLVEDSLEYAVYHNEPLVFTTSLVNKTLQEDLEWNRAADAWLAEVAADYQAGKLSKEEFEKETKLATEGKRPVKADTIGTKKLPWFYQLKFLVFLSNGTRKTAWPIGILGDHPTDSIAVLDETRYYLTKRHLNPNQVSKQKAGTYKIQVLLAGIKSNEVTVRIRKKKIPHSVLHSENMRLRLGNYYLERNKANKAKVYAKAILKKDPHDIEGLVLSGESYIIKKKYKLALVYFEKAVQQHKKQFPGLPEEPLYLLGTVTWLKEKL